MRRPAIGNTRYPLRCFGKRFAELLEASPLSQNAAAKPIGVTSTTLSTYRLGQAHPSDEATFEAIVRVLADGNAAVLEDLKRRALVDELDYVLRSMDLSVEEARALLREVKRRRGQLP